MAALEQDIRHAYAEMKTLLQAEEKVRMIEMILFFHVLIRRDKQWKKNIKKVLKIYNLDLNQ